MGPSVRSTLVRLFIMVGAAQYTRWLSEMVALDDKGFALTGDPAGGDPPYANVTPWRLRSRGRARDRLNA